MRVPHEYQISSGVVQMSLTSGRSVLFYACAASVDYRVLLWRNADKEFRRCQGVAVTYIWRSVFVSKAVLLKSRQFSLRYYPSIASHRTLSRVERPLVDEEYEHVHQQRRRRWLATYMDPTYLAFYMGKLRTGERGSSRDTVPPRIRYC